MGSRRARRTLRSARALRAFRTCLVLLVCGICAFGTLCALWAGDARAEINMEESLELLVDQADRIVVGKVRKAQHAGSAAAGKNKDLGLFLIDATETLKGSPARSVYCVGTRDLGPEQLAAYGPGTELLLFLSETVQATSFEGVTCNLWALRNQGSSAPYLITLGDPKPRSSPRLLSATTFKVLRDRESILAASRDVLKRLAALPNRPSRPRGEPPRRVFLEVPYQTEAYEALYSGSACYLYVPESLFPKAKASFH